jgi:hypothetical protein
VRFSRVFDYGVKRWLSQLNARCQGERQISEKYRPYSYKCKRLIDFRQPVRGDYRLPPLQISGQAWSAQIKTAH